MHYKKISKVKGLFHRIHISPGRVPRARRYGSRALFLGRNLRDPRRNSTSVKQIHKSSRYSSLRIPLTCALTLLLVIGNLFCMFSETPEVFADGVDDNSDITTYATTTVNPTASLTIGGDATNKQVIASPGSTAYRSHTVTVDASDIEDYSLILSGPTNLVSGTSTVVAGAENKTPADMEENTWGYSWGGDSKKETSTYKSLSPTGTTLTGDRVSGFKVNFTRNLFFAAKFSEDADPGRYQANVTLSLAATPRAVATGFNGIYDMQDMTGEICAKANIGDAGSLEDVRDGNVYTVRKYEDGKCWMARNLSLALWDEENDQPITLNPEDSNVQEDWVSTTGKSVVWPKLICNESDASECNLARYYDGSNNLDYWEPEFGYYYSFGALSAGESATITGEGTISQDICPKGWHIPSNEDYYEFLVAADIDRLTLEGIEKFHNAPYDFLFAGGISDGRFWTYNYAGYVWTNTVYSDAGAYDVGYDKVTGAGNGGDLIWTSGGALRDYGRTARCIAKELEETSAIAIDVDTEE